MFIDKTEDSVVCTVHVEPSNRKQAAITIQILNPWEHFEPLVNCELGNSILFTAFFAGTYESDQ